MPNLSKTVTFLFAGDGSLASDGLSAFLQTKTNFLLLSECHDGASAIADIEAHSPEIAVIDVQLPDMTGGQVIQAVRAKNRTTKIIVLGAVPDRDIADRLLAMGADAYIVRSGPSRHLNDAIRYIRDGGKYLAPQLTADLAVNGQSHSQDRSKSDPHSGDPGLRAAFEAQAQVVARLDQALERAQSAIEALQQKVEQLSAGSPDASSLPFAEESVEQRKIHSIRNRMGTVAASLIVGVLGFQLAGIVRPGPLSPLADSARAGTSDGSVLQAQAGSKQDDPIARAADLLKRQQYVAAEKLCRTLLQQDPANTAVSRILASALFHQNRVAESAQVVQSMAVPSAERRMDSAPPVKAPDAASAKLSPFDR